MNQEVRLLETEIAAARAKLEELAVARKAAWGPPPPARAAFPAVECDWAPKNYHMAFLRWDAQRMVVFKLEKRLAEAQRAA